MTPRWHPSRALIVDYANGSLPLGPSLAIRIHLEACSACRGGAGEIEEDEGRRLAAAPGEPLDPGALGRVLARLEEQEAAPRATAGIFETHAIAVPASLEGVAFLPPVRLGQDIWVSHLGGERVNGWRTYLLCGPANMALPPHGHLGDELIVVLEGQFHDHREFGPGDFAENGPDLVHSLQVSPHGRAVALIASAGPIEWRAQDQHLGQLFDI